LIGGDVGISASSDVAGRVGAQRGDCQWHETDGPGDRDLPPMAEKVQSYFAGAGGMDWSNDASVVDFLVWGTRVISGSARSFDEAAAHDFVIREMGRASNYASRGNHALISADRWRERLGEFRVPTLVIQGSDDPVLPYGHGGALAREIPGATLLAREGMGHELHPADWDTIVRAILRHTE
jgi:pimeloyl-ACP methyl ester carboxylesterase